MEMQGFTVIGFLPVYRRGELDHYVIAVETRRKTVTGCVKTLEDGEWYWGHYFDGEDQGKLRELALRDLVGRAGLAD